MSVLFLLEVICYFECSDSYRNEVELKNLKFK